MYSSSFKSCRHIMAINGEKVEMEAGKKISGNLLFLC